MEFEYKPANDIINKYRYDKNAEKIIESDMIDDKMKFSDLDLDKLNFEKNKSFITRSLEFEAELLQRTLEAFDKFVEKIDQLANNIYDYLLKIKKVLVSFDTCRAIAYLLFRGELDF